MKAKEIPFYRGRYEPTFGHNTKQWWAYDFETDELCDVPIEVLESISRYDFASQGETFQELLDKNPDWLYDEGFRYKGDLEI